MTQPLNSVGKVLTTYEGTPYNRMGYTHIVLTISETTSRIDGNDYRFVQTVIQNADGKPGQRGVDFWVTDSGSMMPVNTHLQMLDNRSRSNIKRVPKHYVEHCLRQK